MRRCLLRFGAAGGQWHEGALAGVRLGRAHLRIERTEGHDAAWRCIVEAAAFDAAHVNVALIHKWFDEECERFAAGPERWVGADMRPQRLHEFKTAANVGNDLRQGGRSSTGEHAQRHIGARPYHVHKLLERKVWGNGFVALFRVLEQREGIAERRTLADGEE